MEHQKQEETVGHEIWPATPRHKLTDKNQEEVDFCNALDKAACKARKAELSW